MVARFRELTDALIERLCDAGMPPRLETVFRDKIEDRLRSRFLAIVDAHADESVDDVLEHLALSYDPFDESVTLDLKN
jgi:hypothetical protein